VYDALDDLEFCHVAAGFITGLLLIEMGLTFGQQVGRSSQIDPVLHTHKAGSD
jgi:hypothetical protein